MSNYDVSYNTSPVKKKKGDDELCQSCHMSISSRAKSRKESTSTLGYLESEIMDWYASMWVKIRCKVHEFG